jgi:hypothetical protein
MKPAHTIVHRLIESGAPSATRPTGVSLHGHTFHSREGMLFIPRIAAALPPLRTAIDLAARSRGCAAGIDGVDWARLFWTPPLAPRQAFELEAQQLTGLGLAALVSLTDHDDITAPVHLNALPDLAGRIPISAEWTFPFRGTFFHIGVHNLPAAGASSLWGLLASATRSGEEELLLDRLAELRAIRHTLLVLNHPFWDEKGIGQARHQAALLSLLTAAGACFDALEWNGFRPGPENQLTLDCAQQRGFPVVSGGDRHGLEPNSCINVTAASTFDDFAAEVRHERHSEMLLLPHHFQRHALRVIHHIWEILRDDPEHGYGWKRWDDRVFFTGRDGVDRSLREYWGDRPPAIVKAFIQLVHLMGHPPVRQAVRAALSSRHQEGGSL